MRLPGHLQTKIFPAFDCKSKVSAAGFANMIPSPSFPKQFPALYKIRNKSKKQKLKQRSSVQKIKKRVVQIKKIKKTKIYITYREGRVF